LALRLELHDRGGAPSRRLRGSIGAIAAGFAGFRCSAHCLGGCEHYIVA
jgi:hypothetical protein